VLDCPHALTEQKLKGIGVIPALARLIMNRKDLLGD